MFVVDGRKVVIKRAALGLTQKDVAARCNTTPNYISNLENAESGRDCSVDFALRLARALCSEKMKTSIEDLLTEI